MPGHALLLPSFEGCILNLLHEQHLVLLLIRCEQLLAGVDWGLLALADVGGA